MKLFNRWLQRRRMGEMLGDQFIWMQEAIQLLKEEDPEAAIRVLTQLQAIMNVSPDPADPLARPRAATDMILRELETARKKAENVRSR